MNDPLLSLNAPPPRYLVESDSEDEEGQGLYPGSGPSRPKIRLANPVQVDLKWKASKGCDTVVLGVGQAGRYLIRKAGAEKLALEVLRDGEKIGEGYDVQGSLVVHVEDLDNEGIWDVAKALWNGVQSKSWTVIGTYLPSLYIPDLNEKTSSDGAIRYLSTDPSSPLAGLAAKLTSPNYTTGLAAAIATLAAHPSSASRPLNLLTLPLPLSYISNFTPVISSVAPAVGSPFAQRAKSSAARWDDTDDEPYAGPGMGYRKKAAKQELSKEDYSGMYM